MRAEILRRAASAALLAILVPGGAAAEDDGPLFECLICHGEERPAGTPSLGGQPELYILYQLVYFRDGQRKQEVMSALMEGRDNDELRALSAAVAELAPPEPAPGEPDAALIALGADLALSHRCGACHLPDYEGAKHVPRLAGQDEAYLVAAMHDYKEGRRIGPRAQMAEVLSDMSDADLEALAHYLAHGGTSGG
ncbi:MAG: c-type cytochrome [Paracoccaceae bacterium]